MARNEVETSKMSAIEHSILQLAKKAKRIHVESNE